MHLAYTADVKIYISQTCVLTPVHAPERISVGDRGSESTSRSPEMSELSKFFFLSAKTTSEYGLYDSSIAMHRIILPS